MLTAALGGTLGMGEAYMDGVWDCDDIDELFYRLAGASIPTTAGLGVQAASLLRMGRRASSFRVGEAHYDLGNDIYAAMLDKRMTYSCAYWDCGAADLDRAQEDKLALIARKLDLKPHMRVLDIGSGWGSLAGYLAENFQVSVTGLTVSRQQADFANKRYEGAPVQTLLQDYRDHHPDAPYDRIVSVGMFEHVGARAYRTFFRCAAGLLADDGLMLLHTIGNPRLREIPEPWMAKYIFPNSVIPDPVDIALATRGIMRQKHMENLGGRNYWRTLRCLLENFDAAYPSLDHTRYDDRFRRMWRLYLGGAAGSMRAGSMDVWQYLYTRL
jgi:cyclopropane-fatty-acyl-phospholipid synthase